MQRKKYNRTIEIKSNYAILNIIWLSFEIICVVLQLIVLCAVQICFFFLRVLQLNNQFRLDWAKSI